MTKLRAPFPWFGGKSKAAPLIWERFGDVANYIEPFAGSLAVLLSRPTPPRIETVNDLDCYLSNFWRAVQVAPDEVAKWADWPVNEADLHARDRWLQERAEFRERMSHDPDYYDAKIAGWWVWGKGAAIGGAFVCIDEPTRYLGCPPDLRDQGTGVHALSRTDQSWAKALCDRLRRVRVLCGDWQRALTRTAIEAGGSHCAILLDPPYSEGSYGYVGQKRRKQSSDTLSSAVRGWAIEHGNDPSLRIALCGLEGTVQMPPSWEVVEWRHEGGYGNQRKDKSNVNKFRERIWFSPHCLKAKQPGLFGGAL